MKPTSKLFSIITWPFPPRQCSCGCTVRAPYYTGCKCRFQNNLRRLAEVRVHEGFLGRNAEETCGKDVGREGWKGIAGGRANHAAGAALLQQTRSVVAPSLLLFGR